MYKAIQNHRTYLMKVLNENNTRDLSDTGIVDYKRYNSKLVALPTEITNFVHLLRADENQEEDEEVK